MSLNFDYSKVADQAITTTHPEDVGKDPAKDRVRYNPVFDSILQVLMVIGVGSITEKTLQTVQDRIAQYQKVFGPLLFSGAIPEGIYIKDEDVARYVGLSTNVSTMTDAKWNEHLAKMILREAYHRTSTYQPQPPAYDMLEYLAMRKEDGDYYVQAFER